MTQYLKPQTQEPFKILNVPKNKNTYNYHNSFFVIGHKIAVYYSHLQFIFSKFITQPTNQQLYRDYSIIQSTQKHSLGWLVQVHFFVLSKIHTYLLKCNEFIIINGIGSTVGQATMTASSRVHQEDAQLSKKSQQTKNVFDCCVSRSKRMFKKDFEQTEKARCRHAAARRDVNGLDVQTV